MTYHQWGDTWFAQNGKELQRAEDYICQFVKRYSLCSVVMKEKYGTLRYEHIFPPGAQQTITKLDYLLIKLFGSKEVQFLTQEAKTGFTVPRVQWNGSFVYSKWVGFGKFVLKIAIKRAAKKFPDVREELLADYDEDYLC